MSGTRILCAEKPSANGRPGGDDARVSNLPGRLPARRPALAQGLEIVLHQRIGLGIAQPLDTLERLLLDVVGYVEAPGSTPLLILQHPLELFPSRLDIGRANPLHG